MKEVENVLGSGSVALYIRTLRLEDAFYSKPQETPPFRLPGHASLLPPGAFLLHQLKSARHFQLLQRDATFETNRPLRHHLALIGQTGPGLVSAASIASHMTASVFSRAHIKILSKAVRHAQVFPERGLTFHPLDEAPLHITVFPDASFAKTCNSRRNGDICSFCRKWSSGVTVWFSHRINQEGLRGVSWRVRCMLSLMRMITPHSFGTTCQIC